MFGKTHLKCDGEIATLHENSIKICKFKMCIGVTAIKQDHAVESYSDGWLWMFVCETVCICFGSVATMAIWKVAKK